MNRAIDGFDDEFAALSGPKPFRWQRRLFKHLVEGRVPAALDLPTGLGKTSVMAIWLIARAHGAKLPCRLVYIVDRRAVVDQATYEAGKLRDALEGTGTHFEDLNETTRLQAKQIAAELKKRLGFGENRKLPISTLRGAHVDNREWLHDPAAPAIIVGTVDMIGSRLLFEGYGVSRKMRPYQAGLLGTDALVVLDEAHLVPPFAHLLRAIEQDTLLQPDREADRALLPRFVVLPLSATQRRSEVLPARELFCLQEEDAQFDAIVCKRLSAKKRLQLCDLGSRKLEDALADEAWKLSEEGRRSIRCIVYCDSREVAEKVGQAIKKKAGRKKGDPLADTELFVGARRVHERDNAAQWLKDHGFIDDKEVLKNQLSS
jgi:CRISPR-associated endonuclease/helicase Cas3